MLLPRPPACVLLSLPEPTCSWFTGSREFCSIGNEAKQTLLHPTILQPLVKHFITLCKPSGLCFNHNAWEPNFKTTTTTVLHFLGYVLRIEPFLRSWLGWKMIVKINFLKIPASPGILLSKPCCLPGAQICLLAAAATFVRATSRRSVLLVPGFCQCLPSADSLFKIAGRGQWKRLECADFQLPAMGEKQKGRKGVEG